MKAIALLPACLILIVAAPFLTALAAEAPAASTAFTSRDPVVLKALALVKAGKFHRAETLLSAADSRADAEALRARQETSEIIRRTRIEYSLDAAGLLAKIRRSIPDATARDVERWAKASAARYRMIDGKKLYFRREPQNIFLFCDEAKDRRAKAGNAPRESNWKLTDHLKAIVDEAERTGQVEVRPIRHRLTFTLTLRPNTPGVKAGSRLRVWLPYPQEYRQQRDVKLISTSPEPTLIAPSAVDGNPVGGAPQRTIYFEQQVADPTKPIQFKEVFDYNSYAYYPKLDEAKAQPLPPDWNGACLGERPPHIVFAPALRRQAASIIGRETNPLAKARRIFRWVSANIKWNAEDEYGIIPSFATKGITAGRGDCGVQATVFITLCRIAGVPARWQSGLETKPGASWGMHDWAEFYIAPWGWLPADVSYGVQKSEDPRIADFYCGHQDSYRTIFNLDWGRDFVPPKQSLRSEPADLQRGEVEVDGQNLYFDQWDYDIKADLDPGPSPR
ncbi:MAG TPA: transglutaminase domain-containing protein [Candidatus Paceibacterota bacterium]|nr:transglutaminase domain-containing protein [Verrucomicrobiota bacterium]HSA09194.1 transglutaminase domain-containing protein [Candidatus Paceibacterota bacterium]